MERQRTENSFLEDDEMGSYGVHPLVHEQLMRCHNPALFGAAGEKNMISEAQTRIREQVRHRVEVTHPKTGITLSA